MEGAPGHQAAGIPTAGTARAARRGFYGNGPSANSFPAYPLESYRTWGGFDWMTATVGGLWDSLLAEGKPWWITANSDSHAIYLDTAVRGPDSDFDANGRYDDPVYTAARRSRPPATSGPGYYSRTHVGATGASYAAVMDGIRDGRVWVDHGGLIRALDVRVRVGGDRSRDGGTTLGGVLTRPGAARKVELTITIDLRDAAELGAVRAEAGPGRRHRRRGDRPGGRPGHLHRADTKVVKSFEVGTGAPRVSFTHSLGAVDRPFYVRVRGTDGNRTAPGFLGAAVDPAGPGHRRGRRRRPVERPVVLRQPDLGPAARMTVYLGLDRGHAGVAEAEHWLGELVRSLELPAGCEIVACTHLSQVPRPHVAVSLALPGSVDTAALPGVPAELAEAAELARREHQPGWPAGRSCSPVTTG